MTKYSDPMTKFVYGVANGCEPPYGYNSGGYCPVLIGDVLPKGSAYREPRYRILQKLGAGGYSTVWLARDLHGNFGLVALKINVSRITGTNNEIKILRWLHESEKNHTKSRNIIRLLDDFVMQSVNGTHECLVTEVMLELDSLMMEYFKDKMKEILYQILLGISYLHERGVTHGDLHMGNIAITLPHLNNKRPVKELLDEYDFPNCTPVLSHNLVDQTESLPAYLVGPIDFLNYFYTNKIPVAVEPLCVKIMDFGNSFRQEDVRPPCSSPIYMRAPEITMCDLSRGEVGSDWGRAADIWMTGGLLYHIYFNGLIMYWGNDDSIFYDTIQMAGTLPKNWQKYWNLTAYCKKSGKTDVVNPEVFWSNKRAYWKGNGDPNVEYEFEKLIDLLREILKMDPKERSPIKDLLRHRFFSQLH